MSNKFKPLAGIALVLAAGIANAAPVTPTVVDFNGLSGGVFGKLVGTSYSEDGYSVTSFAKNDLFATSSLVDADKKGETLTSSAITFQSQSGAAFDLTSFELSTALNTKGGSVLFTYTVAGSKAVTELLSLDNKVGLQTFSLGLDDLTSFSLASLGFQVDNISVTPYAAPAAAVPEPGSMALLLAGLGLVGFVARRRKL